MRGYALLCAIVAIVYIRLRRQMYYKYGNLTTRLTQDILLANAALIGSILVLTWPLLLWLLDHKAFVIWTMIATPVGIFVLNSTYKKFRQNNAHLWEE